jgi:BirA family biotin operon repressor/biotin-[acetyl-CoA-carboxylase] ligase
VTGGLDVRALAARLGTIESIAWMPRVTSTNTLARRVVKECIENEIPIPRAMIIAGEQTGGRGRGTRTWSSPADKGIWATTLIALPTADVAVLPLRIATILATFLRETFDVAAAIKWPNDVLVEGKKIAGILLEGRNHQDETYVIIGTGINVFPSDELPDTAVALSDVSRRNHIDLVSATTAFVEHLDRELARRLEPAEIVEAWRSLSAHRKGDRISCTIGDRKVEGTWHDIDDDGRALIRKGEETVPVAAGDLLTLD